MNGLVLVIGDLTKQQEDLILGHLRKKGILDPRVRCQMQTLYDVIEDARNMAVADDNPESEEADFYKKAFARRTGSDLSKVVAIVTTEVLEEDLYQFNKDNSRFLGHYKRPTYIIRPQQTLWIDEK